ncbi:hypothetical protein [Nocardia asteroides]|uniref:hypothetical protein n=1 Tax=Nocardia asteroides TaxID=1824 RepID=UPI001E5EBA67|nr:hypothetical protein [Nocardia asteroides]UGT63684.1 hypothetical protein LTT61_10375 [Nocardia asteroides]
MSGHRTGDRVVIGVWRETARGETRVALTPAAVRRLTDHGLDVTVETGAGERAGFADSHFRAAGARIAPDAGAVGAAADIVAWVKTPAFALSGDRLRPGTTLIGFQDPHQRRERIDALAGHGIRSIAFESVPRTAATAEYDALTPMSRVAGGVAYTAARALLPAATRKRPIRSLVLGFGAAGRAALDAALAAGDTPPTVVAARRETEPTALAAGARACVTAAGPAAIRALVPEVAPDIVLCAALHRGDPAPLLLDDAALGLLAPGSVVVDLAAKAGGNCSATRRDTTRTLPNGVVVTHRSNYPAARPGEASHAYAAATTAMILRLVAGGEPPTVNQN